MKKKYYLILFVGIFFLVGEAIVRIDQKFDLLGNSPQKIAIEIESSTLRSDIENKTFLVKENQFRVLVLGDSYINGGGIDPELKFSKVFERELKNRYKTKKEVLILDVSRASNNTLDNYQTFKYYIDTFQPNLVVLGYNFNDILGDIKNPNILDYHPEKSQKKAERDNLILKQVPPKQVVQQLPLLKRITKKAYNISELLEFLSSKTQKELKLKGVVMPFGEFYFLTSKAYQSNQINLKNTFAIFDAMTKKCSSYNSQLIVYKMPEFNLLKNPELFYKVDSALLGYFNTNTYALYINGNSYFDKESGNKYLISKHDGHPNTDAHQAIANTVLKAIQ